MYEIMFLSEYVYFLARENLAKKGFKDEAWSL